MEKYHIYTCIHSFFVHVYIHLHKERALDAFLIANCIVYIYKYL